MNKEILIKYLNNNCSDEEFDEFVRWVNEKENAEKGHDWALSYWEKIGLGQNNEDKGKYHELLDKICIEIDKGQDTGSNNKVVNLKSVKKWLSQAAAILFIPLLGTIFYLLSSGNFHTEKNASLTVDSIEVVSPIGSRTIVELSDGTVVDLNYGSSLKYPATFTGDKREITLSGEGFFDVAHNPDNPFVVKTEKLNITALGTAFNVHAYHGDNVVATTLVKGKVLIEKVLPDNSTQKIGTMVPGQHVKYYTDSGKIISSKGKTNKYIDWKEGKLVFDNEPILEVAEVLGRMFNVDFEVDDEVKYLSYTVTFNNDPLYLILDLMTETTPVSYKILARKRLTDGSYSKQKIQIIKKGKSVI